MILWPGGDIPDKAKPQVVRFVLNLVVDLGGVFEIDLGKGSRVFLSAATGTG